jgi:hypothetical protein
LTFWGWIESPDPNETLKELALMPKAKKKAAKKVAKKKTAKKKKK